MSKHIHMSLLAKSVLAATISLTAASAFATLEIPQGVEHDGMELYRAERGDKPFNAWTFIHDTKEGTLGDGAPKYNIYFQGYNTGAHILNLDGARLGEHYINAGSKSESVVNMLNGARVDFIEAGNADAVTNLTVNIKDSTLFGAATGKNYDHKPLNVKLHDKDYAHGAAIFVDPDDNGTLTVKAENSIINGDITAAGNGTKSIQLQDSMLNGAINLSGASDNNIVMNGVTWDGKKSDENLIAAAGNNDKAYSVNITNAKATKLAILNSGNIQDINIAGDKNDVSIANSHIVGDTQLVATGTQNVRLQQSQLEKLTLLGDAKTNVLLDGSEVNGGINASAVTGETNVVLTNDSNIKGNISLGISDKNTVVLAKKSSVEGDITSFGQATLDMDEDSAVKGNIVNVKNIHTSKNNIINVVNFKDTKIALFNGSQTIANRMQDSVINMDTSSHFLITDDILGSNAVNVVSLSPSTAAGRHVLGQYAPAEGGTMTTQFANGKQNVVARNGAYNYDLKLNQEAVKDKQQVVLTSQQRDIANDVKGAMAGLDASNQTAHAMTNSIAHRLNALNSAAGLGETTEGVNIWADYLYQNTNHNGAAAYHGNLQGMNIGADKTWNLADDTFIAGMAFGNAVNKLHNSYDSGNFEDRLSGNFYSLYAGWQQNMAERNWGMFTNGSVSYGAINTTINATNVGAATDGVKSNLKGTTRGNSYNAELRGGVNVKVMPNLMVQPYAVVGSDKATAGAFNDAAGHFSKNSKDNVYLGAGTRVVAEYDVLSTKMMPWIDASYVGDVHEHENFTAMNAHPSTGGKTQTGIVGIGMDVGVTKALSMSVSSFSGVAGSEKNDRSVQAGVKYNF